MSEPHDQPVYEIGDLRVTRVRETILRTMPREKLHPNWPPPDLTPEEAAWITEPGGDATTPVILHVHTWVVFMGDSVLLIDTGIGNGKIRAYSTMFPPLDTPYLDRLAAAGVSRDRVDHVLLTHLHTDHVGWNTVRSGDRWVPTFPRARYVFSADEPGYFATPAGQARRAVFDDSLAPVIDAGQATAFDPAGGAYLDGVSLLSTPGHAPGHFAVEIRSKGQVALFSGDIAHTPVQIQHPDLDCVFCADPAMARISRRRLFDHAATTNALMFTAHFPETGAGRVERQGAGYRWRFA